MRREPARLGERIFDLLVVGGGIYGAWIAYDAALRGLSVALVERDDWGSGTSSASSKLIHGGLRYLEHGHLGLVAKALRERARLLRFAPHRVWPLRFLLPVYGDSRASRAALQVGLALYDLLAGGRRGLPPHRQLESDDLQRIAGWLEPQDLRGGFVYGDAGTDDARMTLELVDGALTAGAVAVNHARMVSLLRRHDGAVDGAQVQDVLSGKTHEVRARCTVAAVGPWALQVAGCDPGPLRFSKGVHLVLPPLPGPSDRAVLLTAPSDRRVFFLVPWYGATLVGTTDTDYHGPVDQARVEDADRDYLLSAVRHRCPGLGWSSADVRGAFVGVRTLQGGSGKIGAVTREWTLAEPHAGLLVPIGGKLTSARVEAARTIDRCVQRLGLRARPSLTGQRRLPWAPATRWVEWSADQIAIGTALGLDPLTASTCIRRHGVRVERLWSRLRDHPDEIRRIDPRYPFCVGEVGHAIVHEMALTTQDVLRRRLPLTILGAVGDGLERQVEALLSGAGKFHTRSL